MTIREVFHTITVLLVAGMVTVLPANAHAAGVDTDSTYMSTIAVAAGVSEVASSTSSVEGCEMPCRFVEYTYDPWFPSHPWIYYMGDENEQCEDGYSAEGPCVPCGDGGFDCEFEGYIRADTDALCSEYWCDPEELKMVVETLLSEGSYKSIADMLMSPASFVRLSETHKRAEFFACDGTLAVSVTIPHEVLTELNQAVSSHMWSSRLFQSTNRMRDNERH